MTLGILGGGQLGRMTALAAVRLGIDVRVLAESEAAADGVRWLRDVTIGDWTDADVLRRFADGCDAVTVESEWAPADRLADAAPGVAVWPSPATLHVVRDEVRQRVQLCNAGLPGPDWGACSTAESLRERTGEMGLPVVVKRRRGSYDGYGNATIRDDANLDAAWTALADADGVLVEAFVPFVAEASVIVARSAAGETAVYPVFRTEQRDHRCHAVTVPSGFSAETEAEALRVAVEAAEAVGAVGLLAVEVFVMADGSVLVNELAPRPHNTGHLTIEACHTSQFENHVRAVLGLPLGDASLRVPAAVMVNVLGQTDSPARTDTLADALVPNGASVHLYGKRESRRARKMGHVTATAATPDAARRIAEAAAARLVL